LTTFAVSRLSNTARQSLSRSPILLEQWVGADAFKLPFLLKCDFGRSKTKAMEADIGLSTMAYHPSGSDSFAAKATVCRHGLQRFEDSKRMPLPTCRLLPCGAGLPNTTKVKLLMNLPPIAWPWFLLAESKEALKLRVRVHNFSCCKSSVVVVDFQAKISS